MTVTAVQGHTTSHAVADTAHRVDQINVQGSRATSHAVADTAHRVDQINVQGSRAGPRAIRSASY